jgi:transcriptional regulator with XRE-family HTH domain
MRRRHRLMAYGRWQPLADAAGTRRRVEALTYGGWSLTRLAGRLGWSRQVLQHKMRSAHVSSASAAKVRALYDELWDQAPPEGTKDEKRAATMARRYARDHGWVPPLAWDDDDLDDPAAVPVPGWDKTPVADAIRQAREQAGLSRPELAALVGVSRSAVQQYEEARCLPGAEIWVQLELTLGPLGVVRDPKPEAEGGQQQREDDAA